MLQLIELIAERRGIGAVLAEGTREAARKIGGGAEKFSIDVKGINLPMHDPRAKGVLGLGYAVNPHGADHCANLHDTGYVAPGPGLTALNAYGFSQPLPALDLSPTKVQMLKFFLNLRMLQDSLCICQLPPYSNDQLMNLIQGATGWNCGMMEFQKFGDRVFTLARLYNLREGITAADDVLPHRLFEQHVGGPSQNNQPYKEADFMKARSYYYRAMGWDDNGVPAPETLSWLDLGFAQPSR
jgi:aldehyde:ferredoxin oxidoreductase